MKIHIGSRLSYQGDLCTVRYIGEIVVWPGIQCYGVEWDNVSRGKNDGEVKGVKYFDCMVPGAGSFLKTTKLPDHRRNFNEAVKIKYIENESDESMMIQVSYHKFVENVGMDKIKRRQQKVDGLETMSLAHYQVSDEAESFEEVLGPGDSNQDTLLLKDQLPNDRLSFASLKYLDLSYNLIQYFETVASICAQAPKLQSLVVNGNRLMFKAHISCSVNHLTTLSLASTLIRPQDLVHVAQMFPNLRDLVMSENLIEEITMFDFSVFTKLERLDISCNSITSIPTSLPPSIISLNVSENKISTLDLSTVNNLLVFGQNISELDLANLRYLNISSNSISSWDFFDDLAQNLPSLSDLRVHENPLIDSEDIELYIIARLESLQKLNGMALDRRTREEAELLFISKVAKNQATFDRSKPHCEHRWQQLCQKHGDPIISVSSSAPEGTLRSKIVNLIVIYKDNQVTKKFLQSFTIQKIKTMLAKEYKLSPHEILLYYSTVPDNVLLPFDDDLDPLSSYGLQSGDKIYIKGFHPNSTDVSES